jgi:hypothetical protein
MRRVLTDNSPIAATTADRSEHGVRHLLFLPAIATLLLIAASPGQAVIGAESTLPASEQDAKPAEAVSSQEPEKSTTEAEKAKGSDAKWQPPPMPEPAPYATVNISPEKAEELVDKWGVELLGMRLTAAGMMLDFRFRVLDANKALPLFDSRIKPHIVAERSKIKLPVPMAAKVGAFRPTNRGKNIKADKTYYMIFGNPDRHVKAGEKVTVVIGDFKVEHLMVN